MAKVLKMWRTLAVVSAAALTLALVANAFAQEAPPVAAAPVLRERRRPAPWRCSTARSPPTAPTVTAWDQDGECGRRPGDHHGRHLDDPGLERDASSVTFSIDGSSQSESESVTSGGVTEIALDLTSGMAMAMPDDGMAMPDDGMAMPDDGMAMPDDGMAMPDGMTGWRLLPLSRPPGAAG